MVTKKASRLQQQESKAFEAMRRITEHSQLENIISMYITSHKNTEQCSKYSTSNTWIILQNIVAALRNDKLG